MNKKPDPDFFSFFLLLTLFISLLFFTDPDRARAETIEDSITNPTTTTDTIDAIRSESEEIRSKSEGGEQSEAVSAEKPSKERASCSSPEPAGEAWLDRTHAFMNQTLCERATWFDSFFGNESIPGEVLPGALVVWRNGIRWTEGNKFKYLGDFSIRWRLPQLENLLKKARFFIVSGSQEDKFMNQPGQPVNPGVDPATGVRKPLIGVQMDLLTWLRSIVSIDMGIKIRFPLDPFIRMRYQHTKPFEEVYLVRFTETALWSYLHRFTETSQFDLERKITTFTLVRWSNYATYLENTPGITWNTGVSLITQLSPLSSVSYDTSMWGVNHPEWTIANYRVASRYRRNFYRPWLFLELEPEVTWPKNSTGKRDPLYAAMITLEIQFGK